MWRHDWSWLALSRLLIVFATLANFALATRTLGVHEYGLMGLALTVHSLTALFFISPAGQHLNKNLLSWWSAGSLFLRFRGFFLYTLFVATVTGALAMFYWHWQDLPATDSYATVIALLLIAGTWNASFVPSLNLLGWAKLCASLQCLSAIGGLVMSVLLSIYKPSAVSWLYGQVIGLVSSALIANAFMWKHRVAPKSQIKADFISSKSFMEFSAPLSLAAGLMWLQWNGWRPIVQSWSGLGTLGVVLAGYMLASYFWAVIEGISQQALHPRFFSKLQGGVAQSQLAFKELVLVLAPLYTFTAALALLAAPWVAWLVPSEKFPHIGIYFSWAVFVELCRVLAGLFSHSIHVDGQSKSVLPPYLWGLSTMVCAFSLLYLVNYKSVDGVMISLLLGAVVVAVRMLVASSRYFLLMELYRTLSPAIIAFGVCVVCAASFEISGGTPFTLLISIAGLSFVGFMIRCSLNRIRKAYLSLMTTNSHGVSL